MALPEDAEPAPPRLPERRRAPGGAPAPPVTPGCPLPGTALAPPAPASLSPPVPATHQLSQLPPSARSCPPWVGAHPARCVPQGSPTAWGRRGRVPPHRPSPLHCHCPRSGHGKSITVWPPRYLQGHRCRPRGHQGAHCHAAHTRLGGLLGHQLKRGQYPARPSGGLHTLFPPPPQSVGTQLMVSTTLCPSPASSVGASAFPPSHPPTLEGLQIFGTPPQRCCHPHSRKET